MKMLFTGLLLLSSFAALCQRQKEWGIHITIPVFNEKLNEGRKYLPFQLSGNLAFKPFLTKGKSRLTTYLEPQLVWVTYSPAYENDFEIGMNAGLLYQFDLNEKIALSTSASSGPHYISAESSQQAGGFIFSDNFTLGIKYEIHSGTYFGTSGRFRHISNANLKKPNKGIDTWFMMVGIHKTL